MKPLQRLIKNSVTFSFIVLLGFGLGPFWGRRNQSRPTAAIICFTRIPNRHHQKSSQTGGDLESDW